MGPNVIIQNRYVDAARADRVTGPMLVAGDVKPLTTSTIAQQVKVGDICRIEVSADTYVAFGESTIPAVTVSTSPAVKVKAGIHNVVATGEFLRTSIDVLRLEVTKA